ncbi:sensor histidine kinase [Sphaerisporangium corydalis]|uniref:histidine kinase n=1 Tax=Sphaerisporangium corydalis TaxID=1441875 RepID=A0ABV9E749_9ACTN|nr:histidine kinase [Sphaerisporangium corydalis]
MNDDSYRDAEAEADCRSAPGPVTVTTVIAGVGVMVALTIWARLGARPAEPFLGLDIAAGVLSWALAPVVLWRPVPAALGLTLLALVSPAATPAATLAALLVAQRRGFRVAVAVGAAGIAAHAVRGVWRPIGGISYAWWLVLIVAGYGALVGWGALAQARRALVRSLRERARRAEAEQGRRVAEARMLERTRIAREMHDVLAHRLSLLATYAGALEYRPDSPPEQLSRAAGVVRAGVHQALDELREVISVLRDEDTADDQDPEGWPQRALADLPRLVDESRDAGGQVRLRDEVVDPDALPPAAARTAYRVVREGLTNARKHAASQPVEVVLEGRPGARFVIDIRNPLREGGAAAPITPGTGTGLVGLTERVQLAGGRLDHEVTAGEFRLHAWLPWPA